MSRVDSCGYNPGLELMTAYQGVSFLSSEKKKDLCEKLAEINRENTDLSALNNALVEAEAKMRESNGKIKKIDFTENNEIRDLIDKVRENHPDLHVPYQFNETTFTSTMTILGNKIESHLFF
ncbi:MAG: hypothetical protein HYZ48_04130 [Chlamydiales bacterium]|nr:hypothetical protein [Chlamydiales bacterium]